MEQVLFRLHVRSIVKTCNIIKPKGRVLLEKFILFVAIVSLSMTIMLHFSYVSTYLQNRNCLVIHSELQGCNKSILYPRSLYFNIRNKSIDILNIHVMKDPEDFKLPNFNSYSVPGIDYVSEILSDVYTVMFRTSSGVIKTNSCVNDNWRGNLTLDRSKLLRTYTFSIEKGYLLLPNHVLQSRNVTMKNVYIPSSSACFGHPVSSFLLKYFEGYDTVTKNWVIRSFGGRGYLLNTQSDVSIHLSIKSPLNYVF